MIVSLHVATGATAGALAGSRRRAVPLGVLLHFLGDVMPHEDIESRRFEIATGVAALCALAVRRGPLSPAVWGAAACSAPDLEHLLPLRREVFPSHRWAPFHRSGGAPAALQLVVAGAVLGLLLSAPPRATR
jgi:integral membrane sensor domain MASE1